MSAGNIIITLIVIALIVVGGAYYFGYFDEEVAEIETPAGEVEVETPSN